MNEDQRTQSNKIIIFVNWLIFNRSVETGSMYLFRKENPTNNNFFVIAWGAQFNLGYNTWLIVTLFSKEMKTFEHVNNIS